MRSGEGAISSIDLSDVIKENLTYRTYEKQMPQSTGGGKGPAWEGYHGRERKIFLSTDLLILFIGSLAKGYAHYKSHRRCKKPIELSNFVSGVRDTISKKANCMYSNLTHYNENLEAKNSELTEGE